MDIQGVEEHESEGILDPKYEEMVECEPIPKIDWDKKDEDKIHA